MEYPNSPDSNFDLNSNRTESDQLMVIDSRYMAEKMLGKGSRGIVFLANDLFTANQKKAVKLIKRDYLTSDVNRRFKRTFDFLQHFDSYKIIKLYDYGKCELNGEYLVLEYCPWKTLEALKGSLTVDSIIRIIYDLARTLSETHANQINHYDLKPGNLFIDLENIEDYSIDESIVKISNFGLSKLEIDESDLHEIERFIYTAPEIIVSNRADSRADLFSLGMIGYTLLTGAVPYVGGDNSSIKSQKLKFIPDKNAWQDAKAPESLINVLTRCLNPNPVSRPRNASEIMSVISRSAPKRIFAPSGFHYTPFVGRKKEQRRMRDRLKVAVKGEQWAIFISGEQEIGTSRLIDEFALKEQYNRYHVIRLEKNNLSPLRDFLNIDKTGESGTGKKSKVDHKIWLELRYYFQENIAARPIIICWHDFDSVNESLMQEFKDMFVESKNLPILWLLETKSSVKSFSSLTYSDHVTRINLKPLPKNDFNELIKLLFLRARGYEQLSGIIWNFIGGKPGWALPILNHLAANNNILYSEGRWFIVDLDINIDNNLKDLLQEDLKTLKDPVKYLIEWLAVLNQKCHTETIRSEMNYMPKYWKEITNEIDNNKLIEIVGGCFQFRFPIIRELIYQNIPVQQRRRLHLAVGRWLEGNLKKKNDIDTLMDVANHYYIASQNQTLYRIIDKVLSMDVKSLPKDANPAIFESIIDDKSKPLRLELLDKCYKLLGRAYSRNEQYEEAISLYKKYLNDPQLNKFASRSNIYFELGKVYYAAREFKSAKKHLQSAFDLYVNYSPILAQQSLELLIRLDYLEGTFDQSTQKLKLYEELLGKIDNETKKLLFSIIYANLLSFFARFEEALELYDSIIERIDMIQNKTKYIRTMILAYKGKVKTLLKLGNYDYSLSLLSHIEQKYSTIISEKDYVGLQHLIATAYLTNGNIEKGNELYDDIRYKLNVYYTPISCCRILIDFIGINLNSGNLWRGLQYIRRALGISRRANIDEFQVIILIWAVKLRHMSAKSYNKLLKFTKKTINITNHPISNYVGSFLLAEFLLETQQFQDAAFFLDKCINSKKDIDYYIPKSIIEVMDFRIKLQTGKCSINNFEFEKMENLGNDIYEHLEKGQFYSHLLNIAIDMNKRDLASRCLEKANYFLRKVNADYLIGRCYELYSNACINWNYTEEAQISVKRANEIYNNLGLINKVIKTEDKKKFEGGVKTIANEVISFDLELSELIRKFGKEKDSERIIKYILQNAIRLASAKGGNIFKNIEGSENNQFKIISRDGENSMINNLQPYIENVAKNNSPLLNQFMPISSKREKQEQNRANIISIFPISSLNLCIGALCLYSNYTNFLQSEEKIEKIALLSNLIGMILNATDREQPSSQILEVKSISSNTIGEDGLYELKGRTEIMRSVFNEILFAAKSDIPVLLLGESGTGKELTAKLIHRLSERKDYELVSVNCATLKESNADRELFGHVTGGFTGAVSDKAGFVERADKGTLFLDEIDLTINTVQAMLLRVIQSGEFVRLGDPSKRKTDFRLISAAKSTLLESVELKRFREDLYYRINAYPINLPPLREKTEDIPILCNHFIRKFSKIFRNKNIKGVSKEAMKVLTSYHWSGNVRQLENAIYRAVLKTRNGSEIEIENLPREIVTDSGPRNKSNDLRSRLNNFECKIILHALEVTSWNRSEAARILNISRQNLQYKIDRFKLTKYKLHQNI